MSLTKLLAVASLGALAYCNAFAADGNDLATCTYRSTGLAIPYGLCEHWRQQQQASDDAEAYQEAIRKAVREADDQRMKTLAAAKEASEAAARERLEQRQAEKNAQLLASLARDAEEKRLAATPLTRQEIAKLLSQARSCIGYSDRVIARMREIGEASGVIDQRVLYNAGVNKVECKETLAQLNACSAAGRCARTGYFVAAPVTYTLPASEIP